MNERPAVRYTAPALDKGLDILELLASLRVAMTMAEVAESTSVLGVTDVGFPIRGRGGEALASLTMPFVHRRTGAITLALAVEALRLAAGRISDRLRAGVQSPLPRLE